MNRAFLAIGAAAVALSAAPADARHYGRHVACTKMRHGRCVRADVYRVGYAFGPSYGYTEYSALPQPIVTRYHLRENFRYVNRNGRVYVVNPTTYRVIRVITVP
jgi:hypothetical protein